MPGPLPKDPAKRARTNKDTVETTELPFVKGEFFDLPDGYDWHPMTHEWWEMWRTSAIADRLSPQDISFLLDTARLHSAYWYRPTFNLASEVRQRMAAFGATPADRARLRMTFVDADQAEERRKKSVERKAAEQKTGARAKSRYEGLKVVG